MNKKRMKLCLALLAGLVIAGLAPAVAGEEAATDVKIDGWVVCKCCGAKNANAEGKACVMSCHKDGADLVFVHDGQTYQIADQKAAQEHVGQKVWAVGKLEGQKLAVDRYLPADEKGSQKS